MFSENQGEIVPEFVVILDQMEFEAQNSSLTVDSVLRETVREGRVGALYVDPESLTMGKS